MIVVRVVADGVFGHELGRFGGVRVVTCGWRYCAVFHRFVVVEGEDGGLTAYCVHVWRRLEQARERVVADGGRGSAAAARRGVN